MRALKKALALTTLTAVLGSGAIFAQDHHDERDHHDHPYVKHDEWRKGEKMRQEDWARGERIDYRHYHLRRPPSGYEWREVDGNYVLAAVATGLIVSTVVASTVH